MQVNDLLTKAVPETLKRKWRGVITAGIAETYAAGLNPPSRS